MPTRVFAEELQGPAWDRVSAIRKDLYGGDGRGLALDPERVPAFFHHLLPYASLLTTGEDGAFLDFKSSSRRSKQTPRLHPSQP
jgi:hypothetical protein